MFSTMRRAIVVLLFVLAPSSYADSMLLGLSMHSEFAKEQFIGALYSDRVLSDTQALMNNDITRRMELRVIAKRLSSRRLGGMWIEGMAVNNPPQLLTQEAGNMAKLAGFVKKKLVAGDSLSIRAQGSITTVALNGTKLGQIESDMFFNMLLRTWIGPVPLSSDFRGGLLTEGNVDSGLLATFEGLAPAPGRAAQIAAWGKPKVKKVAAKPKPVAAPVALAAPTVAANIPSPSLASAPTLEAAPEPEPEAEPEAVEEAIAEDEEDEEDAGPALTAESILSRQLYNSQLVKWIYKEIRYPSRAVDRGQEGSVRLAVTIGRKGEVLEIIETAPSQYGLLNKAALKAVNKAAPLPEMPEAITTETFTFTLPILFKIPK